MATITKRGDTFRIKVSLGYDTEHKQIIKSTTFKPPQGVTPKKAEKLAQQFAFDFENRCKDYTELNENMRFSELADWYFENYAPVELKPSTAYTYKGQYNNHIKPVIGNMKLKEITTPKLTRIMKSMALNPQTATIDDRARQYLTAAHNSSQHLGELFKDLLDVTKLDDGRLKPTLTPVEMTSAVRQIADRFAPILAQHKLNYSFGSAEGADVNGRKLNQLLYANIDVSFLTEILDNLIGNAAKYTPEGGGVWVNVQGDGDRVLINVTDTGIGISTEDLGHVFQKFYRVDNSETRKIGGTGLGLYLVKQRTEAMGGRVWAESQFGEGSTFYVSLPRLSAEDYSKQVIAAQNAAAMQQFRQNK